MDACGAEDTVRRVVSCDELYDPPVGSNPMGIDGFRAIALELFLQTKERPATDIVVPTSRGDLMWGVAQGFIDLREAGLIGEIPRVHAAEPFPRISRILMEGDYRNTHDGKTAMVSIGGSTSTYQAVDAIRRTGGSAIPVDEKRGSAGPVDSSAKRSLP
ncbi:PLP-dependent lyase/thiolase (plasmid) [Neorhizobium galegae]|nr:PLP-dependent lyase/thiolase [Neorhizobium galegae]